jgi:hypothetical protein
LLPAVRVRLAPCPRYQQQRCPRNTAAGRGEVRATSRPAYRSGQHNVCCRHRDEDRDNRCCRVRAPSHDTACTHPNTTSGGAHGPRPGKTTRRGRRPQAARGWASARCKNSANGIMMHQEGWGQQESKHGAYHLGRHVRAGRIMDLQDGIVASDLAGRPSVHVHVEDGILKCTCARTLAPSYRYRI